MRIAIVADWLTTFAGAEHTIAEFHELWPEAPIFTTVARKSRLGPLAHASIRTGRLQPWYRLVRRHQLLLPWMPRVVEEMDLDAFDVILSSSHAVAKGIIPSPRSVHICYCHTPMRYAWEMEEKYLEDFRIPRWLRPAARRQLTRMRRWDLTTAKRVDVFLANSTETQRRIKEIYGRDSQVIPPPVHERFLSHPLPPANARRSFLAVGRLVPYKRFDLLIDTANKMKLPLTIVGTGQEEARLKKMAGPTVTFLGFMPDGDLPAIYAQAKAFLFPPLEDAGIVPLEAQACGTPVIAYGQGGVRDSIKDGKTGLFFDEQTAASLENALQRFSEHTFYHEHIREHAREFSSKRFRDSIHEIVKYAWNKDKIF